MKKLLIPIIILVSLILLPRVASATIESFYVDSGYDIEGREEVSAVLRLTGSRAYFYVEEDFWASLSQEEKDLFEEGLESLSEEFDNTIYPKMTSVYGSPGVEKVTILATPMKKGYRGYFYVADEADSGGLSGQGKMVYLSADDITTSLAPAYLAHEFQHLINYNCRGVARGALTEERWLNEALSEYAPTLCGYNDDYQGSYLSGRVKDFIQSPYDPLGEWKEKPADYASVSLFMHYLVGRFGEEIITEMMTSDKVGIANIEQAVNEILRSAQNDEEVDFAQVFADWTVANYLNSANVADLGGLSGKYSYNPDCCGKITFDKFHLASQVTYGIYPSSETGSSFMIKDWAGSWYKFIPTGRLGPGRGDSLSIEFTGSDRRDSSRPYSDFKASVIISDFEGNNEVREFYVDGNQGKFYVPDFGWKIAQVVFIPFNSAKRDDFTAYDPLTGFSFTARSEIVKNPVINGNVWPEGSLIRTSGTSEVYIIKGGFKRWIQTSELFNIYGHFKWEDIIGAPEANVSSYQDASLIRKAGDFRVYEVNGDGTKHWLNMTAGEFEISGRDWGMIYEVNEEEWEWYATGADVLYLLTD